MTKNCEDFSVHHLMFAVFVLPSLIILPSIKIYTSWCSIQKYTITCKAIACNAVHCNIHCIIYFLKFYFDQDCSENKNRLDSISFNSLIWGFVFRGRTLAIDVGAGRDLAQLRAVDFAMRLRPLAGNVPQYFFNHFGHLMVQPLIIVPVWLTPKQFSRSVSTLYQYIVTPLKFKQNPSI